MPAETVVKALLLALTDAPDPAVYVINRLNPELLCFFVPETMKHHIEAAVQPKIQQMPKRWDCIETPNGDDIMACHQALSRRIHDLFRTWELQAGEVVVDLTGATSAMAAAMASTSLPWTSRLIMLADIPTDHGDEGAVMIGQDRRLWLQGNPWDEAAQFARREACDAFNRGAFRSARMLFHNLEMRVSGGQKPLYRAFADLSDGYGLWDRLQYRTAWEKIKGALKALDMASLWGGPPGLKALLPPVKSNSAFLERLVLDPAEVKELIGLDLLAHAHRRAQAYHDGEGAMMVLVRALEALAQRQLFKQYGIKTWDVRPEQLPEALQESCRTCYLDDVDGKYKLPLHSQFRALAGLGDQMGQVFLREWPKMKPLLDAASHAVLGHGFEPVKMERFHQLYDVVLKVTGVAESSLPKFPTFNI
jgi:CRISPR-associated protein (TIGR02710 family)